MGCDIHTYYEVRRNGVWEEHKDWEPRDGEGQPDYDALWKHPLHVWRNYDLFALLADVRNGHGFAGVTTGVPVTPLDEPRGLPEDVSSRIAASCARWDIDGHSHSYFSLKELLEHGWSQKRTKTGVVSPAGFKEWKEKGSPSTWCGGAYGGDTEMVSNEEMEKLIAEGKAMTGKTYTQISWQETHGVSCEHFVEETLPALQKLADDPEDVRFVFWFDN